jgi:hypothetical protein
VFLEWVKRGGAGSKDPAPLWSELGTWPASKQVPSISPFIRFVNNYVSLFLRRRQEYRVPAMPGSWSYYV